MQHFTAEIGNVGSEEGEHGLYGRIVQTLLYLRREPADRETNTDPARGHEEKLQARLRQRKGAGHDSGDRETERDERSGVVDQAFAFENDNNPARHAQMLSDRQRCHRVWWRDNCAEDKTDRQWQSDQVV